MELLIFFASVSLFGYLIFTWLRMRRLIGLGRRLASQSIPYAQIGKSGALRVLFIGDSTGVGVGASRPEDSVAGRLGADFPEWTIENISVSGRKTRELIPVLQRLVRPYEKIILQIGGNDITHLVQLKTLERDIAEVLRLSKEKAKRVYLLTCGSVASALIFPRPVAWLWDRRTRKVRDIFLRACAEADVVYIDLYRFDREKDPFFTEPFRYHADDLFHPSSAGYGLWYSQLKMTLSEREA